MSSRLPFYGGQALVEGVMMRGRQVCAIAVRAPDKSIVLETQPLGKVYQSKLTQIPFLRGLLLLGDALYLGTQSLTFSVNVQVEDESEKVEGAPMVITMLLSLALGIGIFVMLPVGISYLAEILFGLEGIAISIIEGIVRLTLLISYIWAIGFVPDIRRVFGYHGAEHKTINAFEAKAPLTIKSVAKQSREHPRCGTSFLLTVVIFSILFFSLLGPLPIQTRLISRILLIPVVAMFAYEYIRLLARWKDIKIVRTLLAPNLAIQRLTTREPDEGMIEVAIQAFETMRSKETAADSMVT
ncbi:MAG: DUF1385 domain-containing protein [Anaerolineales bacterium]|nr:DUF1385 domain-containing protein [Anaerolineales bacterium]